MLKPANSGRNYAVFGPGRVGANMAAYLIHLGHRATLISRSDAADAPRCQSLISRADVVCAALPDSALAAFASTWARALRGRKAIHFSGALLVEGLTSYHPLYSFPRSILPPETMRGIAFARQEGAPPLAEVFPGADNKDFVIANKDRAFYHALAVLSGNFAAAIWNETAGAFSERLAVDPNAVLPGYLAGVVDRFRESPFGSLTGPLARRDLETVRSNLEALRNEPKLKALYEAFLAHSWPDFRP